MAFYIRYYEDEVLLQKAEEIVPFLQNINKLTPEELAIVAKHINKLRSGTNRIYLDSAKKRYLLAIGTAQTSIEAFQKNAKKQPEAANANPTKSNAPVASAPAEGWMHYFMYFSLNEDEQSQSFIFKAKIRNSNTAQAYEQMSKYLKEKYGDRCVVPAFSEDTLWCEEIPD
ncbi:MAG: hypothetical protein HUJ98_09615 [Bacteroidaceae bacterium]|nr:hypothetical protein [Bacteroidaceae bacterium]